MRSGTLGTDIPVVYRSRGYEQFGLLHRPVTPGPIGVVIVPAGYQYRIGPYRQHVLLARAFGTAGIPSFRFDPPAIGDSDGTFLDFDMGGALAAAIEAFFAHCPELEGVVLWGICGSASVVAMHVPRNDPHVKGLILVNPWIGSQEALAKAYLKHYYVRKLTDAEFWRKLFSGELQFGESARSFIGIVRSVLRGSGSDPLGEPAAAEPNLSTKLANAAQGSLSDRMADGLEGFAGNILIVLSEADLTAQEFVETARASVRWKKILRLSSVERLSILGADHIFSESNLRALFIDGMIEWLDALDTIATKSHGRVKPCAPMRHASRKRAHLRWLDRVDKGS